MGTRSREWSMANPYNQCRFIFYQSEADTYHCLEYNLPYPLTLKRSALAHRPAPIASYTPYQHLPLDSSMSFGTHGGIPYRRV